MSKREISFSSRQIGFVRHWLEKLEKIVGNNPGVLKDERVMLEFVTADERFNTEYDDALSLGDSEELLALRRRYDDLLSAVEKSNIAEIKQRRIDLSKLPEENQTYQGYVFNGEHYVLIPNTVIGR